MKDLQINNSEIHVIIPRMSSKLVSIMKKAIQLAKEGNRVIIHDIGGQDKILESVNKREQSSSKTKRK